MDSSTKVALLTKGITVDPGEMTPEERVQVALYWVERLRTWFEYLPAFRPLKERRPSCSQDDRVVFEDGATSFGEGVDERLRVAGVKRLKYELSGRPRVFHEGHLSYEGVGEIVDEASLLLSEQGVFLRETWNYKSTPVGWKGRGALHEVRRHEVRPLLPEELPAIEEEHSFLQSLFHLLWSSFKKAGEEKVRRGEAMIARAEDLAMRVTPVRRGW